MHNNQKVSDMVAEVLVRQAKARAQWSGESFNGALKAILETKAGQQLEELRNGPHHDQKADQWQEECALRRAKERKQTQKEELRRSQQEAAWKRFLQAEQRELDLRRDGQLGKLLGVPLPGETPAALRRLGFEDERQAEEGLVALMSNGKMSYKHIEELSVEDMPARRAASRLRTTWLKERLLYR
jgi:hypothetical protein